MKPIMSFRAVHLRPYIAFFQEIGAPIEQGLRRAKLPTLAGYESDDYLPLVPALDFLSHMGMSQGIDELGLRAVQSMKLDELSQYYLAAFAQSPTLLRALEHYRELAHIEDANLRISMDFESTEVKLKCLYRTTFSSYAQQCNEWSDLLSLMAVVRAFAGPTWRPKEMVFRSTLPHSRFAFEQFPNTRIHFGHETSSITVSRSLLGLPHRQRRDLAGAGINPGTKPDQASLEETSLDFPVSLRRILTSYLHDGYPSIQLAAELVGTSVRTLQRRLRQFKTNYSELVAQARFDRASILLRDTDRKIIDIAYEIGYDEPTHFSRAFRRIAGVCPRQYRCQGLSS